MIDWIKLDKAYSDDNFYSLQLEVGDVCYQGCNYCYMNAVKTPENALTDEQVIQVLYDSKKAGITAIEWLGGEPLLRKSIFKLMSYARDLGLKNNMWTGGLPLIDKKVREKTADFCRNGLISIHVSSVNKDTYQKLHPENDPEELYQILNAIEKLIDYGYPREQIINSVTYTGLQSTEDMIETMNFFEREFGILTSMNVYHTYLRPDEKNYTLEKFIPDPKDVAKVYKVYTQQYDVKQLPMNCVNKQYCSTTVAVLNDGTVAPCATIRQSEAGNINSGKRFMHILDEKRNYLLFKNMHDSLPFKCMSCTIGEDCWGCRSRSFAAGEGILGKDPRCFRS